VKRIVGPALVLLFLAPLCGEMLSSSMPPAEWLNPIGVVLVVILYGGGAILVRELTFRWGKGWPTLLVLGAAYGILEEGLMCKSFFDPQWMDVGTLGSYGRWLGVNWIWSLCLTAFHATISTVIPITLVGLMFPKRRDESWAGKPLLMVLAVLLAADVVVGYLFLGADAPAGRGPYRPPMIPYVACLLLVAALVAGARRLPAPARRTGERDGAGHIWFVLTGFYAGVWFFAVMYIVPNAVIGGWRLHPLADVALIAAGTALSVWIVRRLSRRDTAWTDGRRLALCAGGMSVFILFAFRAEWDPARSDNPAGMTLAALAAVVFLVVLARRVWRRGQRAEPPPRRDLADV